MILLRSHIQKSHKEKRSRKGSHFFNHNGTPVNEHATVTTVRVADHANQNEFVKAPDGSDYFGEITAEVSIAIRRQAGLIKLRQGDETEGLEHINRPARLAQLQSVGYQSGIEAVYDVARNYDAVYPGKKGNLLLIKRAKPQTLIYIRLEPSKHGDYYDVKTATPARQDALKNKKPLWERAQSNQIQENPSLRDLSSQSGSDVRNKIPPQNDEIKKSGLYLIKAHVRDYDRVSKTGAIEHIRAHEDHRVRSYARKILGSANSYDLHKIRRDRFGHLPHWNKLDDHTQQAILDAEEEKAKGHKEFEEWVETHGSKKGKKKDAEKVDRSGWEQQLMFKSRRVQHVAHILRKSKGNPNHGWHGRFSSSPGYSIYPQPMDASKLLPKCTNPHDKKEQRKYIDLFMQQFGGSINKAVAFIDANGKKLNISPRSPSDLTAGHLFL